MFINISLFQISYPMRIVSILSCLFPLAMRHNETKKNQLQPITLPVTDWIHQLWYTLNQRLYDYLLLSGFIVELAATNCLIIWGAAISLLFMHNGLVVGWHVYCWQKSTIYTIIARVGNITRIVITFAIGKCLDWEEMGTTLVTLLAYYRLKLQLNDRKLL